MTNGQQSGLSSALLRTSSRCKRAMLSQVPPYCQPNNTGVRDAEYELRNYNFTDAQGSTFSGQMCDTMSIILLPRAWEARGTVPGANQLEPVTLYLRNNYPQYNWKKGHMWNQDLGGPGVTENLVPLTLLANQAHSNNAEEPVKNALRGFDTYYQTHSPKPRMVYGFHYTVEVEDAFWSAVAENIVPNSIHVQAIPIEFDPATLTYNSSAAATVIATIDTASQLRDRVRRLSGDGIWIDQAGNVTNA